MSFIDLTEQLDITMRVRDSHVGATPSKSDSMAKPGLAVPVALAPLREGKHTYNIMLSFRCL